MLRSCSKLLSSPSRESGYLARTLDGPIFRVPLLPLLLYSRQYFFEMSPHIPAACHRVGKRDLPHTPPRRLQWTDFSKALFVGNLPNQSGTTSVRSDDERISFITWFSLKVCNLSEGEALNDDVAQDLKTLIDGCPGGRS